MCSEWVGSFEAFIAHIGLPPAAHLPLDRKDNEGHYEPGNVRWATREEQNANRRQGKQAPAKTLAALPAMRKLHKQGLSTREIAAEVGLGKSQVWKALSGAYDEIG